MGNYQFDLKYTLKQDRLIDTKPFIRIGVCGEKKKDDPKNPYANQCLRINDTIELYSLQSYCKTENTLCYEFEKNIKYFLVFLVSLQSKENTTDYQGILGILIRVKTWYLSILSILKEYQAFLSIIGI